MFPEAGGGGSLDRATPATPPRRCGSSARAAVDVVTAGHRRRARLLPRLRRQDRLRPKWRPKLPKAGLKWDATYQAGSDLAFRRESQALREETLTVGDQRVRTWVIETREILIGSVDGEERETVWWSPELNLDVKRQLQRKVGRDGVRRT